MGMDHFPTSCDDSVISTVKVPFFKSVHADTHLWFSSMAKKKGLRFGFSFLDVVLISFSDCRSSSGQSGPQSLPSELTSLRVALSLDS